MIYFFSWFSTGFENLDKGPIKKDCDDSLYLWDKSPERLISLS